MAAGTIKVVLDGMCKNCDLFDPTFECVRFTDLNDEVLNNLENITCSHKDCCERAYLLGKTSKSEAQSKYFNAWKNERMTTYTSLGITGKKSEDWIFEDWKNNILLCYKALGFENACIMENYLYTYPYSPNKIDLKLAYFGNKEDEK